MAIIFSVTITLKNPGSGVLLYGEEGTVEGVAEHQDGQGALAIQKKLHEVIDELIDLKLEVKRLELELARVKRDLYE